MTAVMLGAVADDLTGACDLAAGTVAAGLPTTVLLGVPRPAHPVESAARAQVVIVALPLRTAHPADAADTAAAAAEWLLAQGSTLLYQKYCSTFDSTDRGNIGVVADALAQVAAHQGACRQTAGNSAVPPALTVGTPATPAVLRTQYLGHLFVGDRLLSESSMRDHPLTPMRDSDIVRVLGRQTAGAVALLPHAVVRGGVDAIDAEVRRHRAGETAHLLVDAVRDADLDALAEALLGIDSHAGGSQRGIVAAGAAGLGGALARAVAAAPHGHAGRVEGLPRGIRCIGVGNRLIVSGSASERTREQVAAFTGARVTIDPLALAHEDDADTGTGTLGAVFAEVAERFRRSPGEPVLVSATASPDGVRHAQSLLGVRGAASIVERSLARVAADAVRTLDVGHLIVAGGDTSGAVAAGLGLTVLRVGPSAAPGVPWMVAEHGGRPLAVLFKSGNFGEPGLFHDAWESAP